jgi:hypothetical protein
MINTQKDVNLKENILMIYQHIIKEIGLIIQSDYNLDLEYKQLMQSDRRKLSQFETICQATSLFLTTFFSTHLEWIENLLDNFHGEIFQAIEAVRKGFQYIVEF